MLYQTLLKQLYNGPVVVATVVAADTGPVGAKLLIWGDAETAGDLDAVTQLVPAAFEVMKTGLPQQMALPDAAGHRQVWLARWQGSAAIAIAQTLVSNLEHKRPQRLVIPLTSGQPAYVIEASQSLRNLQGQSAYIEDIG